MTKQDVKKNLNTKYQMLTVLTFATFSTWLLGFLFNSHLFVTLFDQRFDMYHLTLIMIFIHGVGFLFWINIIKTVKKAALFYPLSIFIVLTLGLQYFTQFDHFWLVSYVSSVFLMSGTMVSSAYYFKAVSKKFERFKIAAWLLIVSYVLLFLFDLANGLLGAKHALLIAYVFLAISLVGAYMLKSLTIDEIKVTSLRIKSHSHTRKDLIILSILIFIITINGGLLTQYIFPSYQTLGDIVSYYWLWPYIIGVLGSVWLYLKYHRGNLIVLAIALMGLSFVFYMIAPHRLSSYFVVVTMLMIPLGALDLFWWGTLGEMFEDTIFPGVIFGIGMFANIMGVFFGGLLSGVIQSVQNSTMILVAIALTSVLVVSGILPLANQMLSSKNRLQNPLSERSKTNDSLFSNPVITETLSVLTDRELAITLLLLQGKSYKKIADELFISVNTVKFYIKSIYGKLNIRSRFELVEQFEEFLIR